MAIDKKYIDELRAAAKAKEEAAAAEKAARAALEAEQNKPKIVVISDYSLKFSGFKRFGRKF